MNRGTTNGHLLLTGCADAEARLWSVSAAGKVEGPLRLKGHDGAIRAVAFSPNGRWCATAGERQARRPLGCGDRQAPVLAAAGAEVQTAHHGAVTAIHFTADGWLLSAGRDNVLRLWQLGDGWRPARRHPAGADGRRAPARGQRRRAARAVRPRRGAAPSWTCVTGGAWAPCRAASRVIFRAWRCSRRRAGWCWPGRATAGCSCGASRPTRPRPPSSARPTPTASTAAR